MPKTDYGPEVKSSMDNAKPKPPGPGLRQGNAAPPRAGGQNTLRMPRKPPMPAVPQPMPMGGGGGMPPDLHRVGAATSIAHAILGNRGI